MTWPAGQHLALTYEIPDNFGGLTTAMLQRSRSITRLTGSPVQILTLATQPGLDRVRDDLVERSLLHNRESLRNLWEEVRRWDDSALTAAGADLEFPEPSTPSGHPETFAADVLAHRDGDTVDVDVLRADGSLLARQRWVRAGAREAVTPFGDAITHTWLWSGDGTYLGGWAGTWELWKHWVATVAQPGPSHLIVDSGTVADAFAHCDIPDTSISVVIHNSHLEGNVEPPYAALGRWRRHLIEQRDGFDALVFLTETQLRDAELLLGPIPNAHVVPNLLEPIDALPSIRRDERRGIAMAALIPRKRLDHAIKALKTAESTTLHIYGSGPREDELRKLIASSKAPAFLEGQTSTPSAEFAAASYSLLTSSKEGLPLVLAEAMRVGCIPISYDMPYGPSDVIEDGVNGFLVPVGDHAALGKTIAQFLGTSRLRRWSMRRAAKRRAKDFAPEAIIARWSAVMRAAAERRRTRTASETGERELRALVDRFCEPLLNVRLLESTWDSSSTFRVRLDVSIQVAPGPTQLDAEVASIEVDAVHIPTGHRTRLESRESGGQFEVTVDLAALGDAPNHTVLVTGRSADFTLTDGVRDFVTHGPWSSAPAVATIGRRPTLTLDKRRGLVITTANPAAVGLVTLDPITISARGADDRPATRFELSAPGCSTTVVDADSAGAATVECPESARWRVRAEIAGTWRDLAWLGDPADVPGKAGATTRVRLTPRGYVRLEVDVAPDTA